MVKDVEKVCILDDGHDHRCWAVSTLPNRQSLASPIEEM